MKRTGGFTLIEVLATLAVLAIGLSAIVAMVLGSSRMSAVTVDRNIAAMIIPEAIADIERIHLVTKDNAPANKISDVGRYIITAGDANGDTTKLGDPQTVYVPSVHNPAYANTQVNTRSMSQHMYPRTGDLTSSLMVWPISQDPKYYGGLRDTGSAGQVGTPFRAIYRLERHPDWVKTGDTSEYEGMYVLTVVVYKDREPKNVIVNEGHKYEQVSDPVVVYLRKKNLN
ncbi:MAG TPA: prepilin-type N-terminal cleavage/methylation domain-containing protein [Planctomycetota bacterium]|jgi:prepilin-type N-terminal cleavage/methylation domain-containing protein